MSLVTAEELARTYDHPSKDPWRAVALYREASEKPDDWGSHRVANAINADPSNDFDGVSRSEVRYVDTGGMPDAARAVGTARRLGWDADEWTETTRALATLVIGIYAAGCIVEENYRPSWSPSADESVWEIETALASVGVGYQHVEREDGPHADELRPTDHISPLGRALAAAGASVADKNGDSVHGLPGWVDDAPAALRRKLAMLLVRERGVTHEGKATRTVQTDRAPRYFGDVARLVESVTGEAATATEHGVTVSADAVRELGLA